MVVVGLVVLGVVVAGVGVVGGVESLEKRGKVLTYIKIP